MFEKTESVSCKRDEPRCHQVLYTVTEERRATTRIISMFGKQSAFRVNGTSLGVRREAGDYPHNIDV